MTIPEIREGTMKRSKTILAMILALAGTLAIGCSNPKKRVEGNDAPKKPVKSAKITKGDYQVEKGDCLWDIAGKPEIYGDNFQWPLIFKSNRDLIQDPDLIYPNQGFTILKGQSAEDIARARDLALKTPKYVPHTKPRDSFGVDYF
jgi:hypothetical protein